MAFELHIEPRNVKTWEQFKQEKPPYSIALDGYVHGKSMIDINNKYFNFNHHEDVDRISTRSTCAQVYVALNQYFMDQFKDNNFNGNIYVNDCDQDVCSAVWFLNNYERIEGIRSEPLINRLMFMEDLLDTTGGAYTFDVHSKTMRQLGWVFQPFNDARLSGKIFSMDASGMRNIIESVGQRISQHVLGDGGELMPDTYYEKLGGGQDWLMIKDGGSHVRSKLFNQKIKLVVSVNELPDNKYGYIVAKMSPYVDIDLVRLSKYMNNLDGITDIAADRWGGGDTFLGSPRNNATKQTPETIEKIIDEALNKKLVY